MPLFRSPPSFSLVPPQSGAAGRAASNDASRQALEAMFGGEAARSAAEHGLLTAADTGTTDAGIRSDVGDPATATVNRSEENTSELQSLMRISYAVFCLKKKTTNTYT